MNALAHPAVLRVVPMMIGHLDAVVAIEAQAYPFPWSRGNFVDSLAAGYFAEVMLDPVGRPVAYQVAMLGVDEFHLLNLTVAPARWGHGHGRQLLDRLCVHSRAEHAGSVWLEVRESNERARRIYLRYGFGQVGVRRGYYPAAQGTREDAIVMSLTLRQPGSAP